MPYIKYKLFLGIAELFQGLPLIAKDLLKGRRFKGELFLIIYLEVKKELAKANIFNY
jgi:hypothetical protein